MFKLFEASGQDVISTGTDQNFKMWCQHLWTDKDISSCAHVKTSNVSITWQSRSLLLGLKPGAGGAGEGLVQAGDGYCCTALPSVNSGSL